MSSYYVCYKLLQRVIMCCFVFMLFSCVHGIFLIIVRRDLYECVIIGITKEEEEEEGS